MTRALCLSLFALLACLLVVLTPVEAAPSATIEVFPGTNAIRKALRKANPGDTLNIHTGTYPARVRVKKANVTLKAAGDGPVIIDAQCQVLTAIHIDADGVTVKGLTVRGAQEYGILILFRVSGEIRRNTLESTCSGAEYGVNVFNSGSIQVIGNTGSGWDDAVVYIGGITSTPNGPLRVKNNKTSESVRGIIIEDSSNVNIKAIRNRVHDNTETGILIHNSDGIVIRNNTVTDNNQNGIRLDAPSSDNVVIGNTFTGHTYDINNEGTGNCFSGNTYVTTNGDVSMACP
jgi:parallel beta-helix repeat protein